MWEQFNKICDDEENNVKQAEQLELADDLPGLIDTDDESDDEADGFAGRDAGHGVGGGADRRVTRSMPKKEAFVSLLAMISVAKLLRAKTKKAQEIRGAEVDTQAFEEARQKELQSFVDTEETYTEIDDDGQEAISTRWVYTYKPLPDGGFKPTARLVARGYEDRKIHQLDTSSPTCTKADFRLVLALSCTFVWVPHGIDITSMCHN